MTSRANPASSTQKADRKTGRRYPTNPSWSITRINQRNPHTTQQPKGHRIADEVKLNGTNFRHTVEFSKNGHTPSPASQPAPGQPSLHYSARPAESNRPARPETQDPTAALSRYVLTWACPAGPPHSGLRSPCKRNTSPAPNPGQIRGVSGMNPSKHRG